MLRDQLSPLCERLRVRIDAGSKGILSKSNLPLGAYGIVPYSKRRDRLRFNLYIPLGEISTDHPNCQPAEAAVVGQCDQSFIYGVGSGDKEMKDIVAVCEMKILTQISIDDYNLTGKELCAQLFTSLIGSEAPLAIVLTNGMFKVVWRETEDGRTRFFTYPSGNQLADFSYPAEKEFFVALLFDVIRCSIRQDSPASDISQNGSFPSDPIHRSWRYILSSRRTRSVRAAAVVATDGSEFVMEPYDFFDWPLEKYSDLQRLLRKEKKRSLRFVPVDATSDSESWD